MESSPADALELAAARSAVEGSALLARAFAATGLSQKELAQRVGVTEGRVSQILGQSVNLRLSTIGRYLRAMGYRLSLSAMDTDGNVIGAGRTSHTSRPVNPQASPRSWDSRSDELLAAA